MGTRRSKHNKGRKPLYKHFERETVRHWESGDQKREREKVVPIVRNRGWAIKAPEPGLAADVARYMEKRRAEAARNKAVRAFAKPDGEKFHLIEGAAFEPFATAEMVRSSDRDVVLQLYIERKISAGQLHAARKWQAWKEQGSIQPNMTIDWSQSMNRSPYQRRGDLTDGQWSAMQRRREFLEYKGAASAAFFDFCLDADRSRSELLALLKINGERLEQIFDDLLTKLCECFGMASNERYRNQIRRWRAAS